MYRVEVSALARRQIKKLPPQVLPAIIQAINQLQDFGPEMTGVKALTDHQYRYRLRVGNYRVLFDVQDVLRIVLVQEVKKRDQNTY